MLQQVAPRFEKTCCLGDNPALVGEISSLFNTEAAYFAVMDEPRMGRMDADNEVIRRTNAMARIRPEKIILAGMSLEAKEAVLERIPQHRAVIIERAEEVEDRLGLKPGDSENMLRWGQERIAVGLLRAKQGRKRLVVDLEESPEITYVGGTSGHLVICEDQDDVAAVIAANYAFSIGAGLILIPSYSRDMVDDINEEFYTIYSDDKWEPIEERIMALQEKLRRLAGNIDIGFASGTTFVTGGIPWGFAFYELPTTHIYAHPDMGISIVSSIAEEQPQAPGVRATLLIEPGDGRSSEIEEIRNRVLKKGGFVRELRGKAAAVRYVRENVDLYPYDLLVISTHAGDIAGERVKYEFKDKEGLLRELTVDRTVGFGLDPKTEMVEVSEYTRFVSLDGVPWHDSEGKEKINAGIAMEAWVEKKQNDKDDLQTTVVKSIDRVKGSMALKMSDHHYMFHAHGIGYGTAPIVLNNACASWHELSVRFIFAGARSYIGPVFPVIGGEAAEVAKALFGRHLSEPLAFALWQSQQDVYGDGVRRPYVMVGVHFTRIRISDINAPKYVADALWDALGDWEKKAQRHPETEIRENASKSAAFLRSEFENHLKRWREVL
jgi:hypothetical protein